MSKGDERMKPTKIAAGIARVLHKNIQGAPGSGAPWIFL
jgi:hypothetical protein